MLGRNPAGVSGLGSRLQPGWRRTRLKPGPQLNRNKRPCVLFARLEVNDRSCYYQHMNNRLSGTSQPGAGGPRPSKGQASRESILLTAAKLATTKGLNGLSIGDLAAEVGMSKSGLYAHFKSKEELELATIETAAAIFAR